MNVKQIIKDSSIEEVYSVAHDRMIGVSNDFINELFDGGDLFAGGECLIFPSKEERNWDRFKPKEPTYKPCESVEQFADLFLGAKVKHKTEDIRALINLVGVYELRMLFDNYTLLDGTPLGIKCEE